MLDASGELVVRINGKPAVVPADVQARLRRKAAEGPFVEVFRILARDISSGKFFVVPKRDSWSVEAGRSPGKRQGNRAKPQFGDHGSVVTAAATTASTETALRTRVVEPSQEVPRGQDAGRATSDAREVAVAYLSSRNPSNVVRAVRADASRGQGRQIALLANILNAIVQQVGLSEAQERIEALLTVSDDVEFGEFKPVMLQELAKIAKAGGRTESAASYALGAVRCAFERGQDTIGGNLMLQSQRLGIL